MSMPYTIIECDTCSKKWFSYDFWGMKSYRFNDGRNLHINSVIGWCKCCNDFTNIEKSLTKEEIKNKLELLHYNWSEKKTIREYLFYRFFRLKQQFKLKFDKLYRKQFQEIHSLEDFYKSRKSPSKCLKCGSTQIEEANLWGNEGKNPILHPNCGGRFGLQKSDMRIAMRLKHRFYSLEGDFLFEEDDKY